MRLIVSRQSSEQGFTLIEVIIALVVGAILVTILASALGTSVTDSSQPIFRLQKTMALHQVIENIRADFASINDIALIKTTIGTGQQSNGYGTYEVVENKFIKFTGNVEEDGVSGDGILKVSIRDIDTGMTLTELFVEW
ncbi:MAG: type II secretion system GspH family protein [Proteobacteria bacterium]|nr:type II secretion system protein [Desulfobulbaceae bacterium]MBU4153849.1 type II secretion system GspH family protein [Pseudomonadota bacterium]